MFLQQFIKKPLSILSSFSNQPDKSTILKDISFISDDQDLQFHYDAQTFFQYQPADKVLPEQIYPDIYPQYSKKLVKSLQNLTKKIRHHNLIKIMNYQLNISLLLCQISYKIDLFTKQIFQKTSKQQQSTINQIKYAQKNSFNLFVLHLKFHSMLNLLKLKQMVKILVGQISLYQNYNFQQYQRNLFKQILNDCNDKQFQNNGIILIVQIEQLIKNLLNSCKSMNILQQNTLSHVDQTLLSKIYIFYEIKQLMKKTQWKNIQKLQKNNHYERNKFRQQYTHLYAKNFYKRFVLYYKQNPSSRHILQIMIGLIILKIDDNYFPNDIFNHIQEKKKEISKNIKQASNQSKQNFKNRLNFQLRNSVKKIGFLIKCNGFLKFCSFLHEASIKEIVSQMNWYVQEFRSIK